MRGDVEYRALAAALAEADAPPCTGDPRFILDPHEINETELNHLWATTCRDCPLRDLCRAYGDAARPPAGVWAGRTYLPRTRRKKGAAA